MWECPACHEHISQLKYYEPATTTGYVTLRNPNGQYRHSEAILEEFEDSETEGNGALDYECTMCGEIIPINELLWNYENGRKERWGDIRERMNSNPEIRINPTRTPINNTENEEVIIPENTIKENPRNIAEITIKCENKRCNRTYIYLEEGDFAECPHCGFNNDLIQHRTNIIKQLYQNKS